MQALRSFKSCLQRQVNEAVRITASKTDIVIMNSKNEFHQAPIVRVTLSRGLHGDQGEDQAPVISSKAGRGAAGRGTAGRGAAGSGAAGRGGGRRGAGTGLERAAGQEEGRRQGRREG